MWNLAYKLNNYIFHDFHMLFSHDLQPLSPLVDAQDAQAAITGAWDAKMRRKKIQRWNHQLISLWKNMTWKTSVKVAWNDTSLSVLFMDNYDQMKCG